MAMRSRAAILPYPADPFLLNYWLKFFDNVWGEEIDKLYIYINSPIEKEVNDYIIELCEARPKIDWILNHSQIDHGEIINQTLNFVKEDLVVLLEDDSFIFKTDIVNKAFTLIESGEYDIVGSKRASCSMEILKRAKEVWGIDYEGYGDQGCNFWPNCFFIRKELLLATDRNFCGKTWLKGDIIEALDNYIIQEDICTSDTFVNTSLQLRRLVPSGRIAYLNQYHGHPDDPQHFIDHTSLFDGKAAWTHVGSLSSGISGVLMDNQGRSLARRQIDPPKSEGAVLNPEWCKTEMEKGEWERRVCFWSLFFDASNPSKIAEFRRLYHQAIERIIIQYRLSRKSIDHRKYIYRTVGL